MVNVKKVKLGTNERYSFSKINEVLDMPNLIEVQKSSYKWFVEQGLKEVLDVYKRQLYPSAAREEKVLCRSSGRFPLPAEIFPSRFLRQLCALSRFSGDWIPPCLLYTSRCV